MINSHPENCPCESPITESTHEVFPTQGRLTIRSIVLKSPKGSLVATDVEPTCVESELTVGEIRELFARRIPAGWTMYAFSPDDSSVAGGAI